MGRTILKTDTESPPAVTVNALLTRMGLFD